MFAEKEIITKRKINRFHSFILLIKIYAVCYQKFREFFFFFFGGGGGGWGRQEIEYFALMQKIIQSCLTLKIQKVMIQLSNT